jgi:hypothetical protein
MMKSSRMRYMGYAACMGKSRGAYRVYDGET